MTNRKIDYKSLAEQFNKFPYKKRKLICNSNGIFSNLDEDKIQKSEVDLLSCQLMSTPFFVYNDDKEVIRSWVQGIDIYKNLIKIDLHDSIKNFMSNSYLNSYYTITKIKENEMVLHHNQMKKQFNNLDSRMRQFLCNINGVINCSERDNYQLVNEILSGKFLSINQGKSAFVINVEKLDKDGNIIRLVFNQLISDFVNIVTFNSEYKAII